jgi:PAS domain S-box-containing protein
MGSSSQVLQLVLNAIPVRVFWKDLDLRFLGCNEHFAHDAGVGSPAEIVGKDDLAMPWAGEAARYRADDRDVIATGRAKLNYEEPHTRPDGSPGWARTSKVPLRDVAGQIFGILGLYEDITERKRDEERRIRLMRELDHRVKNNLAAVQSLAGQTLRNSTSLREFEEAFMGRLRALASTHEALAAAKWEGVYLDEVVRRTVLPLAAVSRSVVVEGKPVLLPARMSSPLCLVLHELATNAAKHGALSASGGVVRLAWEAAPDGTLRLRWDESGGPPVTPAAGEGLGTMLVRGLIEHDCGGSVELDYRSEGLRCRVEVPIAEEGEKAQGA